MAKIYPTIANRTPIYLSFIVCKISRLDIQCSSFNSTSLSNLWWLFVRISRCFLLTGGIALAENNFSHSGKFSETTQPIFNRSRLTEELGYTVEQRAKQGLCDGQRSDVYHPQDGRSDRRRSVPSAQDRSVCDEWEPGPVGSDAIEADLSARAEPRRQSARHSSFQK